METPENNPNAGTVTTTQSLRDLFVDELKDIYWAEKALVNALPNLIKNASQEELKDVLTAHWEETQEHVKQLENVFSSIGEKPAVLKCEAMDGLIREAEEIMIRSEAGMVKDSAIIAAAQKVEHYEIAAYGTLCSIAKKLGEDDAADLLGEILDQEKEGDKKLTQTAESIELELVSVPSENYAPGHKKQY